MLKRLALKKEKGFTLVELMIVIAIIALLIIVLLPRVGPIKNKSKEAGIKTNMVMLEAIVQSDIEDYPATDAGVEALETKIANDLSSVTVANQMMKNPVTGGTDIAATAAGITTTTVVAYQPGPAHTGDNADNGTGIDAIWKAEGGVVLANSAGVIGYAAYINKTVTPNKLNVYLMPYGIDNKRMVGKIISQ